MIFFVTVRGYDNTYKPIAEAARGRIDLRALLFRDLIGTQFVEKGTYILTDLDRLSGPDLILAAGLYRRLKAANLRVLNDPARIRSRYGLLRLLAERGINDFNAYRLEEERGPERWPVFLRCIGGHDKETTSDLCFDRTQLDAVIRTALERGLPIADLIIVEYAGEEVRPGLFRKLSTFRIGPNYFAANNVHDTGWHAKTGKRGIAGPELYREELEIVRDNTYRAPLAEVFELAHIEFGRADFGFLKGRPQIFEINTKPSVSFEAAHPMPERVEVYRIFKRNFLDALEAVDTPSGGRAPVEPSAGGAGSPPE
jgi:hypothetical protein